MLVSPTDSVTDQLISRMANLNVADVSDDSKEGSGAPPPSLGASSGPSGGSSDPGPSTSSGRDH